MKKRSTKTAAAIAAIALITILVMALGAVAVLAQDDAPEKPALPFGHDGFRDGVPSRGGGHDRDDCHGRDGSANNDEALAEALGIPVEELNAARQKAAADRLAQAVEDGLITKDQANTLLAMQALKGYLDREALLAQALGLSAEEFTAAREAGTLRDLLAEITPADLQANMQTAVEKAIQQAVDDNIITAEQAALVQDQLQNGLSMREKFGSPGSFGGRRGSGGRGFHDFHGYPGAPQADEDGEAFSPFGSFRFAPSFGA